MTTSESNHSSVERMRFQHALQREVGRLVAPLWVPLAVVIMRFVRGYRIEGLWEIRQQVERLRRESDAPLLICANHLTMVDSFLIAWALAPTWRYLLRFDLLPWNTPERTNFASTRMMRILAYLAKCVPVTRGGPREDVASVLDRIIHLTALGECALIFPEGGRSRSGRVEADSAAWGVGRIVGGLPGCRVLCVYMRGDGQDSWSTVPKRGERLVVDIECIEPKSDARGVRRSMDFARQIVTQLAQMERSYFARRQ